MKSYPPGVPAEIPTPEFRSLREMMDFAFREYADRPAYSNMGTSMSYRELDQYSMQFACYLQNTLGLTRGERVAIMLPNVLQYPIALCGIFRAGLVVVNVNPLYTARELEHQLKDSGARCIIILENFATTLEEVIDNTNVEHVVTTGVGDLLDWPGNLITNFVLRHVRKVVPKWSLDGDITFRHALRQGKDKVLQPVELGFADIAFLQYTGGTTGLSKGAMLSHRNMVHNVFQTCAWTGGTFDDVDRIVAITALPLYHIFSLKSNCLLMMWLGGENVLITNPRDVPGFVKTLKKQQFTYFTGVNTMFAALLNEPGFSEVDFGQLRLTIGGGMAVQEAISKQWEKVTGQAIVQAYGLTETSPAATINPLNNLEFNGSIGMPIPSTEVRICDDDGKDTELGEICVRGPQVMEGYWQNAEETAKVMLPGGWFRTGDMAVLETGYYRIMGRLSVDIIKSGGYKVGAGEVETVIAAQPGVEEVAVVGVPDDDLGERIVAFVVGDADSSTLIDRVAEQLSVHKRPREVRRIDALPRNALGKVQKTLLRGP